MEPPTSDAVTEESPPAAVATGITITTASSDYGEVLFDGSGQAIYLFDKEHQRFRTATATALQRGRPS